MNRENYNFGLQDVNGHEIINFLKSKLESYSSGSIYFESQTIEMHNNISVYKLSFSMDYNNWGTMQPTDNHSIFISHDDVWVNCDEPFDGSEEESEIEYALREWLPTHKFTPNTSQLFKSSLLEVQNAIENLMLCPGTAEERTKQLDAIIEELTNCRSYIK